MAKILIVDDEDALRLLMSRQLKRSGGHEVVAAEDGLAAVAHLEAAGDTFDVIVSDMKMPRLDGMGLLARARALAPETPFIFITGHGSLENAVEAFKTGNVFDYLLKPLHDIRELDAIVERAVAHRRLKHENDRLSTLVRELETARQQLAHLAERDGLTELFNHRAIHERLDRALGDSGENAPLAVLLLDMDGFKAINDTYGHPAGDRILRHVARALRESCPPNALIGRCGGDEFLVVLPGANGTAAQSVAQSVRGWLADQPFVAPGGARLPVPLCMGIADNAGDAGRTPAALIAAADAALYESKHKGGDAVTLHLVRTGDGAEAQPADPHSLPQRTTFDVLDGLVTAIDHKDRYTKRHSEDVAEYALHLVQALGVSDETCRAVRVAGLLHDVGKIGVPDGILRKPGKLTDEEYEVMKNHVTLSSLIIHGLPRLHDVLDAISHHHERWDGRGYPQGLTGEETPLLGRVMAVADAFSAMTLDRPYRAGLTVEQALAEIERGAGTQFDPELAQLFVDTMRRTGQHAAAPARKAA